MCSGPFHRNCSQDIAVGMIGKEYALQLNQSLWSYYGNWLGYIGKEDCLLVFLAWTLITVPFRGPISLKKADSDIIVAFIDKQGRKRTSEPAVLLGFAPPGQPS